MEKKIRLSSKQKEVIKLMREGWIMIIGRSDTTERIYYQVTKGYDSLYFNSIVFANLLKKDLIYQQYSYPFNYILTPFAETIDIN